MLAGSSDGRLYGEDPVGVYQMNEQGNMAVVAIHHSGIVDNIVGLCRGVHTLYTYICA